MEKRMAQKEAEKQVVEVETKHQTVAIQRKNQKGFMHTKVIGEQHDTLIR